MRKNIWKSITAGLLAVALLVPVFDKSVQAEELPYDTYAYDYWEDAVATPAAYVPGRAIAGQDLQYNGESIGAFVSPQDLCKSEDGEVYVADTGNNRIVVLDSTMSRVEMIYDSFDTC